jgi:hypothetical protein
MRNLDPKFELIQVWGKMAIRTNMRAMMMTNLGQGIIGWRLGEKAAITLEKKREEFAKLSQVWFCRVLCMLEKSLLLDPGGWGRGASRVAIQ